MKRPNLMTMDELVHLPVVTERTRVFGETPDGPLEALDLGGVFEDREGRVWGTFLMDTGWARYPVSLGIG